VVGAARVPVHPLVAVAARVPVHPLVAVAARVPVHPLVAVAAHVPAHPLMAHVPAHPLMAVADGRSRYYSRTSYTARQPRSAARDCSSLYIVSVVTDCGVQVCSEREREREIRSFVLSLSLSLIWWTSCY
jgi:hypothetical protein